jgi:endo-1,4-beta-D-glucanase Y
MAIEFMAKALVGYAPYAIHFIVLRLGLSALRHCVSQQAKAWYRSDFVRQQGYTVDSALNITNCTGMSAS